MSAQTRTGLIVLVSIGLLVLGAISVLVMQSKPEAPDVGPEQSLYTVNGRITRLPSPDEPDVEIAHEAIPFFKDASGKVVGMGSMNMPFPLADGVDLTGFDVGDEVTFTFDVWWTPEPNYHISKIEKRGG